MVRIAHCIRVTLFTLCIFTCFSFSTSTGIFSNVIQAAAMENHGRRQGC